MEMTTPQMKRAAFDAGVVRGFGRFTLRAEGVSMQPLIAQGDALDFEGCAPEELAVGAVALFEQSGRWLAHRILAREEAPLRFYQRGDAEGFGYWIGSERIAGRLVGINGASEPSVYVEQVLHIGRVPFPRSKWWGRALAGLMRRMRVRRLRRVLRGRV